MKKWIIPVAAFLALVAASSPARATPLAPGTSVIPGATVEAGTVIASKSFDYSFTDAISGDTNTGTMREEVVRTAGGTLDFVYQIIVKSGDAATIATSSYRGFLTDASQSNWVAETVGSTVTGGDIMTVGAYASARADRTASGATVNFQFIPSIPGLLTLPITSNVLIIKTDATIYTNGNVTVIEGGNGNLGNDWFAPGPEPSSLLLLGSAFAGLGAAGWRRRRAGVKTV